VVRTVAVRPFTRADGVLREACGTYFTGAVARIERGGRPIFERAYGTTRLGAGARPVVLDTRFDLASLTKPFVATLALREVAAGHIGLDEPLVRFIPEWRGSQHERITLRMLLSHLSGMDSGADYRRVRGTDVARFALEHALRAVPGAGVIYSDLGFIAVGVALERMTGRSLASLVAATYASPTLGYRPRAAEHEAIPATENDAWRGRVQGFVHDEKAYLMGGIAGHAGLFGTAADVAHLAEAYLGPSRGRPSTLLDPAVAAEAIREQADDPVVRRGLGWMLKTRDDNSCGCRVSRATFGHTGFVGTSVWADPERDLTMVLLTNAVYFGRFDMREIRIAFHDAVVEELE